jgi:hypothetical protein
MSILNLPKNIKKRRTKKFTQKRQPYKTYLEAVWTWSDVLLETDNMKKLSNTFLKDISIKYGIMYSTLSKKYNKYCKSKMDISSLNKENRGGSNKTFSVIEEKVIYDQLVNNYINKDLQLNDSIIKEIARKKSEELKRNNEDQFKASDGWCNMFKKKWNLSTQTVKPLRTSLNNLNKQEEQEFLDKYEQVTKEIKKRIYLIMMKRV